MSRISEPLVALAALPADGLVADQMEESCRRIGAYEAKTDL